jgi:hypothetical protein
VIPSTDLTRLRNAIGGELIRPEDLGYDEARKVWNGAIDRRPTATARCAEAAALSRASVSRDSVTCS